METKKRSVVKAISFRIIAIIITAGLVYVFTRNLTLAGTVGVIDSFIKFGAYYFHERIWSKIKWGENKKIS